MKFADRSQSKLRGAGQRASLDFAAKKKRTKRDMFLGEISAVVPWGMLEALILPHYPKLGPQGGRRAFLLGVMLRIYCLQQWYNLSDPGAEEALYDIQSMRAFAGLELGRDAIPDETTILNFRHLLERHALTKAIFEGVAEHLAAKGELLRGGTIVDATLNPTDILARNGARAEQQKIDPPPYVPGMDVAGIVNEVGTGVETGVRVGDAVMGMVACKGSHGGYREQIVLGARSVVRTPAGASHVEACTLSMNGLTARQSLDLLNLAPGQVLAVTGAAGAYGGYVIQQAKRDGLIVIADASDADRDLVKSLGADIVVARGPEVAARIREHFPSGVDGLADGAVLNELAVPAVRDGGAFTAVRGFQGTGERGIRFSATSVRSYDGQLEKLDRLRKLVEAGAITLRVADTYPCERAADTHRRLEAGGTRGRLVLLF